MCIATLKPILHHTMCTVQVRSDEILLLQLQVSVRTPLSRQHRHRAARSSGALLPSQVAQPSLKWGTCRIGSYRKFNLWKVAKLKLLTKSNLNSKTLLHNKSAESKILRILHKMAGRRTAVTSGALRSPSPGLSADQAMQVLHWWSWWEKRWGQHDDDNDVDEDDHFPDQAM